MVHSMRRFRLLITVSLFAACFAVPEWRVVRTTVGMAQAKCGGIEGRVTTPEGWLLPEARVFFVSKETKKTASADSTEDGEYWVCLSPGTYDVSVEARGFKNAKRKDIKVTYG